jgi:hypothetical protein
MLTITETCVIVGFCSAAVIAQYLFTLYRK